MQYRLWSLAVLLRFERPLLWEFTLGIRLGAVSARATNSLFLCAACSSQSRLLATARGGSCLGGRKVSLPPARAPSSFLRVRPSHNPFLVFISTVVVSLLLLGLVPSTGRRSSSKRMDAPSGNSPEAECKCCHKSFPAGKVRDRLAPSRSDLASSKYSLRNPSSPPVARPNF